MVRKFYDIIIDGNGGDPTPGGVTAEALEWYMEQAESMQRYTNDKNTNGQMALVVSLSLDGGNRAKEALVALAEKDKEIERLKGTISAMHTQIEKLLELSTTKIV
jgi:formiminotetrahydrofolate cyclodeaminase